MTEAVVDGVFKPWWTPASEVPRGLLGVAVRSGLVETRQQFRGGIILMRLTADGMQVRDRALVRRAEERDKTMIVRYPDAPDVEGPLVLPRPAVFLVGGYDPRNGAGGEWYEKVARYLERYVGCVFYGVNVEFQEDFITWFFHWLNQADIGIVWVERCPWSEFEVGYLLGKRASHGKPEVVMGTRLAALKRSFELVSGAEVVHENLPDLVHAARQLARGYR